MKIINALLSKDCVSDGSIIDEFGKGVEMQIIELVCSKCGATLSINKD